MVTLWSHQCSKNGIYEVSERLAQKKEWLCYANFGRCPWNEPQHLFLRTRGSGVRIPPGVPTENRLTVRLSGFSYVRISLVTVEIVTLLVTLGLIVA